MISEPQFKHLENVAGNTTSAAFSWVSKDSMRQKHFVLQCDLVVEKLPSASEVLSYRSEGSALLR